MNKKDFEEKINELVDTHLKQVLKDKCMSLYASGGIDVTSFENDFRLPKIVLTAALKHAETQFSPLLASDKKEVKNLYRF